MQDVERNKAVMWRQNERNDWPECMTVLCDGLALLAWQDS
jgi:hypothetical protein